MNSLITNRIKSFSKSPALSGATAGVLIFFFCLAPFYPSLDREDQKAKEAGAFLGWWLTSSRGTPVSQKTAESWIKKYNQTSPLIRIQSFSLLDPKRPLEINAAPSSKKTRPKKIPLLKFTVRENVTAIIRYSPRDSLRVTRGWLAIAGLSLLGGGMVALFLRWVLHRKKKAIDALSASLKAAIEGQIDELPEVSEDPALVPVQRTINRMLDSLRERDRMRHSLGRIMDPKIAEILIKENPKLGGLRRKATILFCDIRNYVSLCEQLSVDELQQFLNEYWKGTVEIIMDQEGTIDKFHGDGVCVIFGAPALHPDDPLRAVRTAWRLVQNVESLNKTREEQRKLPIQIGIGIHTGEVIAGNIGSERRMDYTVVGDVVNVAARIEELNKKFGTKILISDNVYEIVENHVRVKTLSLAYLRGHKKPILVHALREFYEKEDFARKDVA